jgi:hypothetical protein
VSNDIREFEMNWNRIVAGFPDLEKYWKSLSRDKQLNLLQQHAKGTFKYGGMIRTIKRVIRPPYEVR